MYIAIDEEVKDGRKDKTPREWGNLKGGRTYTTKNNVIKLLKENLDLFNTSGQNKKILSFVNNMYVIYNDNKKILFKSRYDDYNAEDHKWN